MTHPNSNHSFTANRSPLDETDPRLDAFLLDSDFDDAADRYLAEIRESLADFRNC